jgi:adenylate cyclase
MKDQPGPPEPPTDPGIGPDRPLPVTGKSRLRVPFRISISVAFVLITTPFILGIIGVLYLRNAQLARDLATEIMNRATIAVMDHTEGLLSPLARIVGATATLGTIDPGLLRRPEAFQYDLGVLRSTPQAESIYVGFARDGAFYQAERLPPGLQQFGPYGRKPPKDARFVLRILDASSGKMTDSFFYLAQSGGVVAVERAPARFDPRTRPWYRGAWSGTGLFISDAYVFFSSKRPGLTLSQRIATAEGAAIGAVGADISLETLADFLARERVGAHGVTFIIDDNGRLVGYPRLASVLRQVGDTVTLATASEVGDPIVARAVQLRQAGAGNRFTAQLAGKTYLAAFTPLPSRFGKNWSIGVIAAERDFVGPIRRTSELMIALAGGVTALIILAIFWVSRSLTQPIARIVDETKRIREFQLDEGSTAESRIVEIHQLAQAVEAMRDGLRSFGAYVPKALARTIVTSGKGTGIGGERRALTMLFTDIEDFTRRAEGLTPEEVLAELSLYFEAMSRCIHEHGGTVDKFIGDAVMALWNAPMANPNHAIDACRAVLRCRAVNVQLNAEFAGRGHGPVMTRFGLHSGEVVVGNVGSTDRMQYTAIGAEVNLASRVEGLNKRYGTQIIATGAVEAEVRDHFLFRPLDLVVPAGTSHVIPLFELVGAIDEGAADCASAAAVARCCEWRLAIETYRSRRWGEARDRFRDFAACHPADRAAPLYAERCTGFLAVPPPQDWDGAEHYDTK